MRLVIVPDCLRREIDQRLDAQIALHPDAAKDRQHLFDQLLDHVDCTGVIPEFSLAKADRQ